MKRRPDFGQYDVEERTALARRTVELMRAKGMDLLTAVRAAQSQLPVKRRREIATLAQLPWLLTAVKKARGSPAKPALADEARHPLIDAVASIVASVLSHPLVQMAVQKAKGGKALKASAIASSGSTSLQFHRIARWNDESDSVPCSVAASNPA
jgi:hypothetical protein